MLTVNEAYEKFLIEFPKAKTETIYDWGNFYTCSQYEDGDIHDDEWRIDASSGEIREMDFLEHSEELRKRPNDDDIKTYRIKDLLKARAS